MTVGEELQIEIIEVAISLLLIVSWNILFFSFHRPRGPADKGCSSFSWSNLLLPIYY